MSEITKEPIREIISDFEKDIRDNRKLGAKPSKEVIPFRNDRKDNYERQVYEVRTDFLRYRKDNGRISSDIISYERDHGPLKEQSSKSQEIIRSFLKEKDKDKTNELVNSILHDSQRDAAVITSDGFLVNGNRRKMALEILYEKSKDPKYQWMKVVILPGKDDHDQGGPPTIKEIEQIENRYQLQSEGKAEYSKFDRALSIRRKLQAGMTLEEQLRDDPSYTHLTQKEFKKKQIEYEEEYLKPLECIDKYLKWLNRDGLYNSISSKSGDKEGRWQAFLDYYLKVWKKLENENTRLKLDIDEQDVGNIEEIAFKIIRKREFPNVAKLHQIMRYLLSWYKNEDSRKALFRILDEVDDDLLDKEKVDEYGKELSERDKDRKWAAQNQESLIRNVKKAKNIYEQDKEKETSLLILDAILKKLYHNQLAPENIAISDAKQAMDISRKIKDRANELENIFYKIMKGPEKLKEKYERKLKR